MSKKSTALHAIAKVSCEGCIYKDDDDGVVMWCSKIKMASPSKRINNCIYKTFK